ncbi:MAG: hypothetical protein JHC30_03365 [Caldisericum sp.]|jgi:hypothetical protein|nr:hypothetical protein [Caldisericum sp.]
MKEYIIEAQKLIYALIDHFGFEDIILTFSVSNSDPGKRREFKDIHASFGQDSSSEFASWFVLVRAKMVGEKYNIMSIVLRHFLRNQMIPFVTKDNKVIKIPKKEIYHFLILTNVSEGPESIDRAGIVSREMEIEDHVFAFDEKETYEAQNTDYRTGKPLEPEAGVICKSSIELIEHLLNGGSKLL